MGKLLNNTKRWQIPRLINTDKAPTYGRALALLKREGKCPQHVQHRQIKAKPGSSPVHLLFSISRILAKLNPIYQT
jgi:transposase-like protein